MASDSTSSIVCLDEVLAKQFTNNECPNELIIQAQRISRISSLSTEYASLRTLDVSFNDLTSLDGIEQFPRLRHLSAYCCRLQEAEMIGKTAQLVSAMLQQNGLSDIPTVFRSLSKLRELRLDRNKLTEVRNLSSCSSLKMLDLSRNLLSSIEGLAGLQSLEELKVNHNSITSLRSLKSLPSLRELQVSFNQLTSLEGLQLLPTLESVHAEGNKISTLRIPLTYTRQGKQSKAQTGTTAGAGEQQQAMGNNQNQNQGQGGKKSGGPAVASASGSASRHGSTKAIAVMKKGVPVSSGATTRVKRSDSTSSTTAAGAAAASSTNAPQSQLQEVVGLPYLSEVNVSNNCIASLDGLDSLGGSIEVLDLSGNAIDVLDSGGSIDDLIVNPNPNPNALSTASSVLSIHGAQQVSKTVSAASLSASASAAASTASIAAHRSGVATSLSSLTKLTELKLRGNPISRKISVMESLVSSLALSCPDLRNVDSTKIVTEEEEKAEQQKRELLAQKSLDNDLLALSVLPSPPKASRRTAGTMTNKKKGEKKTQKKHKEDASDSGDSSSDDSESDGDDGQDRDDGNKGSGVPVDVVLHPRLSLKDTLSMEELQFMEGEFSKLLTNCKGTLSSLLRLPAEDVDAALLVPELEAILERAKRGRLEQQSGSGSVPGLAASGSLRVLVDQRRREEERKEKSDADARLQEETEGEEKVLVRSVSQLQPLAVPSSSSSSASSIVASSSSSIQQLSRIDSAANAVSLTWRRKKSVNTTTAIAATATVAAAPSPSMTIDIDIPVLHVPVTDVNKTTTISASVPVASTSIDVHTDILPAATDPVMMGVMGSPVLITEKFLSASASIEIQQQQPLPLPSQGNNSGRNTVGDTSNSTTAATASMASAATASTASGANEDEDMHHMPLSSASVSDHRVFGRIDDHLSLAGGGGSEEEEEEREREAPHISFKPHQKKGGLLLRNNSNNATLPDDDDTIDKDYSTNNNINTDTADGDGNDKDNDDDNDEDDDGYGLGTTFIIETIHIPLSSSKIKTAAPAISAHKGAIGIDIRRSINNNTNAAAVASPRPSSNSLSPAAETVASSLLPLQTSTTPEEKENTQIRDHGDGDNGVKVNDREEATATITSICGNDSSIGGTPPPPPPPPLPVPAYPTTSSSLKDQQQLLSLSLLAEPLPRPYSNPSNSKLLQQQPTAAAAGAMPFKKFRVPLQVKDMLSKPIDTNWCTSNSTLEDTVLSIVSPRPATTTSVNASASANVTAASTTAAQAPASPYYYSDEKLPATIPTYRHNNDDNGDDTSEATSSPRNRLVI